MCCDFRAVADYTHLHFDKKCAHGLVGRRSPILDVLVSGPNGVVAVESKCLEHLRPHMAKFAPAYELEIRVEDVVLHGLRKGGGWSNDLALIAGWMQHS